jgi:hypothetical protein
VCFAYITSDDDGASAGDTNSNSRTSPVLSSTALSANRLTGVIIKAATVQQLGTIEVTPAAATTTASASASDTLTSAMEGLDISGNGVEAVDTEPERLPAKVSACLHC